VKPEILVDPRGEVLIENIEEIVGRYPKWAKRAINSALASEGYVLRHMLQDAIKRGGPPGASWEKLNPYTALMESQSRRQERRKSYVPKLNPSELTGDYRVPLLKFRGGIRYAVNKDETAMGVGFINPIPDGKGWGPPGTSFLNMLKMHAKGYTKRVTRRMQIKFFTLGLPLTARTLRVPARPLIEPVWDQEKENVIFSIERKFFLNMDRYARGGKK